MSGQSETVITNILRQIDDGVLDPGDVIAEDALQMRLGISRTPVREALLKLEALGLVQRLPRKGAIVFKPSLEEFLAILEVHAKLEGQAASLAARRLSPTRGKALENAVLACETHQINKGESDTAAYYQLNLTFHAAVAEAAGNEFLYEMVKSNARKLMAYYRARYKFRGVIKASAHEHRQISTAILDRRADDAEDLMARHVHFDQVTAMDLLASFD
ncbi:GntR family transcriptional regulator [Planktotalea sp.]|uniref:GntR family transcriptional regulator n=1 Tax=Planktotalea sp. TaxID=2029877 RepID=UPI003D6ADB3F